MFLSVKRQKMSMIKKNTAQPSKIEPSLCKTGTGWKINKSTSCHKQDSPIHFLLKNLCALW